MEPDGARLNTEQKRDIPEALAHAVRMRCVAHFGMDPENLSGMAKSAPEKVLIAGLLRYHYPVRAEWVSEKLIMGHFATRSRAMNFDDEAKGVWGEQKPRILKFIG